MNTSKTNATKIWDNESVWNACFGPTETRATVLAEAESQGITPQDYAMSCVVDAQGQGADFETGPAWASLCHQLDVPLTA